MIAGLFLVQIDIETPGREYSNPGAGVSSDSHSKLKKDL